VHSAVTQEVKAIEAEKLSMHAVLEKLASGQLLFLGLWRMWGKTVLSDVNDSALGYAGDVTVGQAFEWLRDGQAVLVDIRTDAERAWVGFVPGAVPLAWKQWPGMHISPEFDQGIMALAGSGKKLLLLCRSGIRSIAAAKRAAALGLEAYNILEGFEGDADANGQRGKTGGWKFHGLPWQQD